MRSNMTLFGKVPLCKQKNEENLSHRHDLPVGFRKRFEVPLFARRVSIDDLEVVPHHDRGAVPHFQRDLSGVLHRFQPVRPETMSKRIGFPLHTAFARDTRHSFAWIFYKYRSVLSTIR